MFVNTSVCHFEWIDQPQNYQFTRPMKIKPIEQIKNHNLKFSYNNRHGPILHNNEICTIVIFYAWLDARTSLLRIFFAFIRTLPRSRTKKELLPHHLTHIAIAINLLYIELNSMHSRLGGIIELHFLQSITEWPIS